MGKCHLCGKKALQILEICPDCLQKAQVGEGNIKRLQQISSILSITADTDTNTRDCMESILEIAQDLERSSAGGKEEKKTAADQTKQ